ncbi:hypothetical protein [Sinomonas sp. P47F7]|uniref:hypothetical protein n=1 Tax=Sinomonas sp. P47F7 TaxID=3410987 RepID=UPI003BF5D2B7
MGRRNARRNTRYARQGRAPKPASSTRLGEAELDTLARSLVDRGLASPQVLGRGDSRGSLASEEETADE